MGKGSTASVFVLGAMSCLWLFSTTSREKPLCDEQRAPKVAALESDTAANPSSVAALQSLMQAYLEGHTPGLALRAYDSAPAAIQSEPSVGHLYARALVDEGNARGALAAEELVLARCQHRTCSSFLVASATHRASVLHTMIDLGVTDAQAEPEKAEIAYQNATRQVAIAMR